MKQKRLYPKVIISRKAARSLNSGHPWVYAGEVLRTESTIDNTAISNGCVVDVFEENGTWKGTGLFSEQSIIRVRLVTTNANDHVDNAFWERRIAYAWQHRVRTMGADKDTCRLIFSEADGFPGLVVDRYANTLVAQIGNVGMELRRHEIYSALLKQLQTAGENVSYIFERCDAPSRAKEGLEKRVGWWNGKDGTNAVPVSSKLEIVENDIHYLLDLEEGQKTGFFLDQKYNRRAVAALAPGLRVMDAFCHVGPFGLNALKAGAAYVNFVDASKTALNATQENAALNCFDKSRFTTTAADIVSWLPELARNKSLVKGFGGPFDMIVLDPPAFAKHRADVQSAFRAYRSINQAAMRLLPRGGYLATCSCSHFMTRELLAKAIAEAAHNANIQLKQVEERQQAPDHPILWGFPESHYLDFFIFQVV